MSRVEQDGLTFQISPSLLELGLRSSFVFPVLIGPWTLSLGIYEIRRVWPSDLVKAILCPRFYDSNLI